MDKENIIDIVKQLTASERVQFIELLNEYTLADKIVSVANTVNQNRRVTCPHCCNTNIYGHGTYRGRSRYKCKSCKKTFNDNTGTAIDGIKKVSEFQAYLNLLIDSVSIRKAAKKLDLNISTVFSWRHKLLSALSTKNGSQFIGIVECDDKQLDISEKGNKKLERESYKRPSDRNKKRGVPRPCGVPMMDMDFVLNHDFNKICKISRINLVNSGNQLWGTQTKGQRPYINSVGQRPTLTTEMHTTIIM